MRPPEKAAPQYAQKRGVIMSWPFSKEGGHNDLARRGLEFRCRTRGLPPHSSLQGSFLSEQIYHVKPCTGKGTNDFGGRAPPCCCVGLIVCQYTVPDNKFFLKSELCSRRLFWRSSSNSQRPTARSGTTYLHSELFAGASGTTYF